MKIIDILNKIANDELEDTKFIYDGNYLKYWKHSKQIDIYTSSYYENVECYNADVFSIDSLNDEIEILDEPKKDKIEKLNLKVDTWCNPTQCDLALGKKIDEIIEVINEKL